nr:MAG TPA: hypothetical protein [Caudoviricetes sp.]
MVQWSDSTLAFNTLILKDFSLSIYFVVTIVVT